MSFHMHLNLLPSLPSYLGELNFSNVSAELSFILLDAMRTVYKEDFIEHDPTHPFITSFAPKLDWSYHPARGSTKEDCEEYDYEDIMTENLGDLARCLYLRNGPVAHTSLSKRLRYDTKGLHAADFGEASHLFLLHHQDTS